MLKKFLEGLVFGGGFAVSFVLIWYAAAYLVFPAIMGPQIEEAVRRKMPESVISKPSDSSNAKTEGKSEAPFHELELEEQIRKSTVIALARYESADDGKMKAVISEILKKNDGVTFYYDVGDEYPSSSYYPRGNTDYGDGVVIFFTGSPAMMKMSMSYSGDRIRGLGDLPIELLKKKCEEPNA